MIVHRRKIVVEAVDLIVLTIKDHHVDNEQIMINIRTKKKPPVHRSDRLNKHLHQMIKHFIVNEILLTANINRRVHRKVQELMNNNNNNDARILADNTNNTKEIQLIKIEINEEDSRYVHHVKIKMQTHLVVKVEIQTT